MTHKNIGWSTTLTVLMLELVKRLKDGFCQEDLCLQTSGIKQILSLHTSDFIFFHMISYVFIPLSFRKSHGDLHVERSILIQQPTGATCCAVDLVRQKRQEAAELIRTLMTQRNTPEKRLRSVCWRLFWVIFQFGNIYDRKKSTRNT